MPRNWTETVSDWPHLEHRSYPMRVIRVERNTKPRGMLVTLEHLSQDQCGRRHGPIVLPLPCRPGGLTASFFQACRQAVERGNQLIPKRCVGQRIDVQFHLGPDGALEPVDFKASNEETNNDS